MNARIDSIEVVVNKQDKPTVRSGWISLGRRSQRRFCSTKGYGLKKENGGDMPARYSKVDLCF